MGLVLLRGGLKFSKRRSKHIGLNFFSQQAKANDTFTPFMEVLSSRREQANRSILVQVQSVDSYKELYSYCSSIGTVKEMLHYSEGVDPMHFILVEFSKNADAVKVLDQTTHISEDQAIPTSSQFLWFRAANRKLGKLKQNKNAKLVVSNGTSILKEEELKNALKKCEAISDQMELLYKSTKLNDLGSRLRYLTARQVESTVSGMFPKVSAYPFGSSVNGFGKMGCDLDIVLRLSNEVEDENSRLIYHCKASPSSERNTNQRNMEVIGDLIHLFLPGCTQVRRILQARVPIIKYHQHFTNVECDLSLSNMSGVYMSDMLYIMGELDKRVRPLTFTIRKWAKEVGLTNSSPGRWLTNFSLTLLVLAFLQKPLHSPPVLPSLNTLVRLAGPSDKYVTEDGIDCTFARHIEKLNFKSTNDKCLEALLLGFFEYYSDFDFSSKAVCINEAVQLSKPDYSAMYIINPLEKGLNVSKNVSLEEVERFKLKARNAIWNLEEKRNEHGGFLSIFENTDNASRKFKFSPSTKHNRLMEVSVLFEDTSERDEIEYKNKTVEQDIKNIKKETKQKIKLLERVSNQKSQS